MAEIRSLQSSQPDASLVALLEGLLADARTGELVALAGMADYRGDRTEEFVGGLTEWFRLSAMLAELARTLPYDEDDEE